jgi:hypothetical protein
MLTTFVNLHVIHLVSRPSKNSRPLVFPHPLRLAKDPSQRKLAFRAVSRIPAQCQKIIYGRREKQQTLATLILSQGQNCRRVGPMSVTAADFDGDGLTRQESRRSRRFDTWRSFGFCRNSSKGNNP